MWTHMTNSFSYLKSSSTVAKTLKIYLGGSSIGNERARGLHMHTHVSENVKRVAPMAFSPLVHCAI